MAKIKYLFFAVLALLLLLSTSGSAEEWELTFEDHPYDAGTFGDVVTGGGYTQLKVSESDHSIYLYLYYSTATIHKGFDSDLYYFCNIIPTDTRNYHSITFYDEYSTNLGTIYTNNIPMGSSRCSQYHITRDGRSLRMYSNGTFSRSITLSSFNPIAYIVISGEFANYWFDDFSTSSVYCIGHKGYVTPADSTIYFTTNTPVIDGYSYYVQMCDPNGAEVKRWNEISFRNTCSYTPALDMTVDGLYYLYIYGQDDKLYYSKPFLFTSGEIPGDMVFQETGTANVDVRNSANQGGEIESGGLRYIYFDQDENGNYPITVSLLEDAFAFKYEHNLVYAMYEANSSLVTFNDLQSSYYITLDGEAFPATAATGNFTFIGNLSDGDLLNISTDTYEFDNEGNISNGTISVSLNTSNLTISTNNLLAEIEANGTANITVNLSNGTLSVLANNTGASGNLITISANATNITTSGPTLSGGADSPSYTNGATSWSYNITNWATTDHIFEFSPDYTKPGLYGYVKDADTQNPLRTTTITIFNDSASYVLWTDSNGMYYKTTDLTPGQRYSVKAAKNRYLTFESIATISDGATTQHDIFLNPEDGAGLYYAPHDVTFTVWEYWNSGAGLPGASYAVYNNDSDIIKTGITDSEGSFVVEEMDSGTRYKIIITYNEQSFTEFYEPGSTYYTIILNKENIIHEYYNNWLNLTYEESAGCVNVSYLSNEPISQTSLIATASNGTTIYSETRTTDSGNFSFSYPEGDYIINFAAVTVSGLTASQSWTVSYSTSANLFPPSYPAWLKNLLFVAIILIFLLAFGKARNDIACGSAAVLTSLGYYFNWLVCSFNFVILIWLISLGAVFVHYKRTKGTG